MGSESFSIKFSGVRSVAKAFAQIPVKLRRKVLRNALAAGGRVFRDEAKRLTPVLTAHVVSKRRGVVRRPGTLRNAIKVRTSGRAKRNGDVGVFVNVVPAKKAVRGAYSPFDPYYWRWVEFGTRKMAGVGMLTKAAGKAGQALQKIEASLTKAMQKFNTPGGD